MWCTLWHLTHVVESAGDTCPHTAQGMGAGVGRLTLDEQNFKSAWYDWDHQMTSAGRFASVGLSDAAYLAPKPICEALYEGEEKAWTACSQK